MATRNNVHIPVATYAGAVKHDPRKVKDHPHKKTADSSRASSLSFQSKNFTFMKTTSDKRKYILIVLHIEFHIMHVIYILIKPKEVIIIRRMSALLLPIVALRLAIRTAGAA